MKTLKLAGLALVAVLLILAGMTLVQYQRAVESWQAEVERLNDRALILEAEITDAEVQAESAYYRGILSSCVGIGMQMSVPRDWVSSTCTSYWRSAYEADWFNELRLDTWEWPPPEKKTTSGITS